MKKYRYPAEQIVDILINSYPYFLFGLCLIGFPSIFSIGSFT